MDMKKLIESMDHIEECGMTEMPAIAAPAPEQHEGNPVTVNVNMNASGKEHVADLLDMMKNAGLGGAEPVSAKTLSPRMDMERLRDVVDGPKPNGDIDFDLDRDGRPDMQLSKNLPSPEESVEEGQFDGQSREDLLKLKARAEADLKKLAGADNFHDETQMMMAQQYVDDINDALAKMGEGYANEPDAQYGDMSDAIPDGNDLNRKKKAYAATQDGDNPMAVEAIKATLMAALQEKKKPDANKNGIPDYAEDGKGPKDLAKGKKGSKPKKGEVPPQFKKK